MIKIAICEDSRLDREMLYRIVEALVKQRGAACEIDTYASGEELLDGFKSRLYALIFMDIMMDKINGVETGRLIRDVDIEVEIVYCTSSKDFAIDAYKVHPLSYLLKPYQREQIDGVIDYYMKKHPQKKKNFIEVKSHRKSVIIPYNDIIYMESDNKVVYIHTMKQGDIKVYSKLDSLEEQMADERFLRCHQSYFLNLDYVSDVMDVDFVLSDERRIPIRKSGRKLLIKKYEEYLKRTF